RVLGAPAAFHPLATVSTLAAPRDPQNRRAHLWLSHLLRLRWLRCRHDLLHTFIEIRQSDRCERHPEYSARHLNDGRVPALWRLSPSSFLSLRRHRDPCRDLRFGRASSADRRLV